MINRNKLEHILEYARQQRHIGQSCKVPPEDMVEIMERLLSACNSPAIPDGSADMLRRWLAFGHGMQNAGCQLPHNLIAETEVMLAAAPQSPGSEPATVPGKWIPVSERMPETDGNYWGWWSESKRQGPVWFIKSELQAQFQSSEITHWMPLPAAPQEVK